MALIATITHVSYIFGRLLNGSDARHHDDHQEDQECPQGMGMFLMTFVVKNIFTHVSYILIILGSNVVH